MMLVTTSLVMGMVLGQRFKVLVLLPAIAAILVITIAAAIAGAESLWELAATAATTIVSLQVGYLVGIGVHYYLVDARATHARMIDGSAPTR
jgi:hypothetical protein